METVLVEPASVMWDGREQTVIKVRIMYVMIQCIKTEFTTITASIHQKKSTRTHTHTHKQKKKKIRMNKTKLCPQERHMIVFTVELTLQVSII